MSKWYSPRTWWAWLNGEDILEPEDYGPQPEDVEPSAAQHADEGQGEDFDGGQLYQLCPSDEEAARLVIIRARPSSMDQAALVADKIKLRLPVTVNLEGVEESTARRIVDFVGGVTYALDGSIKKIGRAVFLCSPYHIPIHELQTDQPPRDRLFEEQDIEPGQAAL